MQKAKPKPPVGEKIASHVFSRPGGYEYAYLIAKRDTPYSGKPNDGEEILLRMVFLVAKDAETKSLSFQPTFQPQGEAHRVVFDAKELLMKN